MVNKVLFMAPLPPPYGGIATWTQQIMDNGLPGWEVKVINEAMVGRVVGVRASWKTLPLELYREMRTCLRFIKAAVFFRPDIVHIASSISSLGMIRHVPYVKLCLLLRIPVIYHYHGDIRNFIARTKRARTKFFFAYVSTIARSSLIWIARRASANLVLTPYSLRWARATGGHEVHYYPNCLVPIDQIDTPVISGQPGNPLRVVFVRALIKSKGVFELLEVAKQTYWAEFFLAGAMVDREFVQKAAESRNVHLVGSLSKSEVHRLVAACDVFLFLSHGEGYHNSGKQNFKSQCDHAEL